MKSYFIYKNDAMRVGDTPQRPYYEEFCDHGFMPVNGKENPNPTTMLSRTRMFTGYRALKGSEEIMIYVER